MKIVKGSTIVVAVMTLASCGMMADPAVMMTEEGLKGFTRYNQDLVSSAKASPDTASFGETRALKEFYEEKHTERFNTVARHSNPGMFKKVMSGIQSMFKAEQQPKQ